MDASIKQIITKYPDKKSAIMPVMQHLQRENKNFLSEDAMEEAAGVIGCSKSKVFGVATYYTMFNVEPVGKFHLQVDTCVPGFLQGADAVVAHLEKKLGIKAGETTKDGLFTLSTVQDLGSCATGPVIQVNDRYFENMTIEKTDALIEALKSGKEPENDPSMTVISKCGVLLNDRTQKDCRTIAFYKKNGGYQSLKKALTMKPADIIEEVKEAGVRGRGGAGFPAGMKWSFLPKNDSRPVYLICNADEGEPGTFKDRQIMEFNPHLVIEGIAISAYAINSKKAFIYIRGEFNWIADILDAAIEEAKKDGQLANVDIVVHRGGGSYVCGDETAQIESLEGKRGNPRVKPPFPANAGLYGCPTVVNNVETLSCIPYIIQNGAAGYKKFGTSNNFGPKIFGVSGHVNKPGIFEYPMGTPLKEILEAAGGVKGKLKGVIVGGLSVAILTAQEAENLILDFDSCVKAGTALGSGGIMVVNDTVSIPELALRTIEFYHHESCGQCVPCREGSLVIEHKLRDLVEGRGKKEDIDLILHLTANIKGLTLCPTGEAFAVPIQAMVSKFRPEFEALVKR
ncbi:MAG TPA: NADH-quinone oxidoreductase subunit NuoF [Spirochaetota bacterium]|nr:NADH-quinone oxidoreductase subunit NuoF [Spirochaetota bacterium]HPF04558.1 NADH-quinone oxidoreductase subunit NuoF [Spirochaetota bacterium]HPJ41991.1 NADH-quinone oxidoreductase subunit NuoF [Spirochaetota bacterium]HPR37669.1 NADH-quinone oxidoreductase subunit NuoF [Spirochaetota bacterium]HRX46083.1 NADH-quinone oxidoreductase subunit NuoF [Spirochaetota bacterium]